MARIARIVYPGFPHHIVHRGNRRERVFFNEEADRKDYLALLREMCLRYKVEVWAWCLMSNHVHLLLSPKEIDGLAKVMQQVARNYSFGINKKQGWTGRLWEVRYYSCVVEKEVYLWTVSGYIEMNPVRAGIVSKAEEWKWSSARDHLLGEKDKHLRLKEWLNEEERKEYNRFLYEKLREENIQSIRRATYSGRPLGGKDFIISLENQLGRILRPKKRGRKGRESIALR
jgi:putative transposase